MFVLKLCTKTVGDPILVACLYDKKDCGHKEDYEEWMRGTILPCHSLGFFRKPKVWEEGESWEDYEKKAPQPVTEEELQAKAKFDAIEAPYQGKTLTVGGKEYPIYNANKDFFPCGNAPEIELTAEEVAAWRQEFRGVPVPDSFVNRGGWMPFDDEVFLK